MVNYRNIIQNLNSIEIAGFFAFFASDAGIFADLPCIRALVGITAHDSRMIFSRNHGDNVLGAGDLAKGASDAQR